MYNMSSSEVPNTPQKIEGLYQLTNPNIFEYVTTSRWWVPEIWWIEKYMLWWGSKFQWKTSIYFTWNSFSLETNSLSKMEYYEAILWEDIYFWVSKKSVRFHQGDKILLRTMSGLDINAYIENISDEEISPELKRIIDASKKRAEALLEKQKNTVFGF